MEQPRVRAIVLILSGIAVLLRLGSEAWIGEDAMISFRTIENLVNGHGLRWNVDERVQVATHPLWMLLNAAAYAATREIPYTLTSVSLACSVAAYAVVAYHTITRSAAIWLGVLALFLSSRSLVLYGTSGFETPLGMLLLAVFAFQLVPRGDPKKVRWETLSLCAGLAVVNRFDYICIAAPPLLFTIVSARRTVRWRRVVLGLSPALAWFLFSVLYYGFAFPNSAPAKLSDQIPLHDYAREGLIYFAGVVKWDSAAAAIMVLALVTAVAGLLRWISNKRDRRAGCVAALGAGAAWYFLYVLRVGGGFLQGRYWVPVLFTGILIIALGFKALVKQLGDHRPVVAAAAGVASVVLFCSLYAFAHSVESWKRRGPLHDRSVARALLKPDLTWDVTRVAAGWRKAGLEAKRRARDSREKHVVIRGPIGFFGEAAGSEVTIVDPVGLADPLLARLPLRNPKSWRPGHLLRPIPRGYLHARQTGSLDRMEPSLAEYYRHLRLVVEGPLFSWERLTTIVGFHVGRYDHLLEGWKPQAGRR